VAALCYDARMPLAPHALTPEDAPALDRLLARRPMAAVFARSHLRTRGLGPRGAQGYWLAADEGAPEAAIVALEGIAWSVWDAPADAAALAGVAPALGVDLLSGPGPLVAPLLAALPGSAAEHGDHCPFERLTPEALGAPAGGSPPARRAGFEDLELLIDFYIRGFYSLARLPTRAAWRARLSEQLRHRRLYLIEEGGVVLSAAQSSAETPEAAMIGGVATLPTRRNRGLSTRCVHALCAGLFADGIREIGLFYLPANTAAAAVYRRLGFQRDGEWWLQRVVTRRGGLAR
jgi:RimJ/RimL family protein N-acetyltransferase